MHQDSATVQLYDLFHERETQTHAFFPGRILPSVKRLEDSVQILWGDPDSGILDNNLHDLRLSFDHILDDGDVNLSTSILFQASSPSCAKVVQ